MMIKIKKADGAKWIGYVPIAPIQAMIKADSNILFLQYIVNRYPAMIRQPIIPK